MELPRYGETTTPVVWHYTDRVGLKGILSSNRVWASDYETMNDPEELRTGRKAVANALSRAKLDLGMAKSVREHVDFAQEVMERGRTFVLSASSDGDSLAQWRAYGDDLRGYAIGFATAGAFSLLERHAFDTATDTEGNGDVHQYVSVWRNVLYNTTAQATEADAFIDLLVNLVDSGRRDSTRSGYSFSNLLVRAYTPPAYAGIVTRLKHHKFVSEDEVRITATVLDADRFRAPGLVGRMRVDLTGWSRPARIAGTSSFSTSSPTPLPITAVRAGPLCPVRDLRDILDRYGYPAAKVLDSDVPYRG
jgi:hypothetical protein